MTERYIVRFRGSARAKSRAKDIVEHLRSGESVTIIEETPRMVLVEADESDLHALVEPFSDVVIVPERHYEPPDAKRSIVTNRSKK
jgi:hypothetical protein